MVQISDGRGFLPSGFDPVEFFGEHPEFAEEWTHYHQIFAATYYRLYERRPNS
jgi:hypothetical protein